jgi:hypothetical protein
MYYLYKYYPVRCEKVEVMMGDLYFLELVFLVLLPFFSRVTNVRWVK